MNAIAPDCSYYLILALENATMPNIHSLDDLKRYHGEASKFFAVELILLKEAVPMITDERLGKAATLLLSAGQTGAALLQLANQPDSFTRESTMLARSFMESLTNFCYVGICDDQEFRAFELHPVYKQFHLIGRPTIEDDLGYIAESMAIRKAKQEQLKQNPLVQEALAIFSETKDNLNWTKKTLEQRINALRKWGKFFDLFFTLNKYCYYSNASEALHGSLWGCLFSLGIFDPDFNPDSPELLSKKLYKDNAVILLHLGMLIHESFTLISFTHCIAEIYSHSYRNRGNALHLLSHILEKKKAELSGR